MKACSIARTAREERDWNDRSKVMPQGLPHWPLAVNQGWVSKPASIQIGKLVENPSLMDDYDVILVEVTNGVELLDSLPQVAGHLKKSSTQLVSCLDYSVELLDGFYSNFEALSALLLALQDPDNGLYFHAVELLQQRFFSHLWNRKIPLLMAPINRKQLIDLPTPKATNKSYADIFSHLEDDTLLGFAWHKWESSLTAPFNVHYRLRSEDFFNRYNLNPYILGYAGESNTTAMPALPRAPYDEAYKMIRASRIFVDTYSLHSIGRNGVDSAIAKTPHVCTDVSTTSHVLYPATHCHYTDYDKICSNIRRLAHDKEFYHSVTEYAFNQSRVFDYKNRLMALKEFLEDPLDYKEDTLSRNY